jgi:phospholipid/cholesterol/gamma-HCH transport system substrate-binding protein
VPTLQYLAKAGTDLPNSLQDLVTYPFTDYAANDARGDYMNVDVKLDLDLSSVLSDIANASTPFIPLPSSVTGATGSSGGSSGATLPLPLLNPGTGSTGSNGLTGLLNSLLGGGGS